MDKEVNNKKNYAIIGNCQAKALNYFLESNHIYNENYNCMGTFYIPNITIDDIDKIYQNILPFIDILFIQPIKDNYRENFKFSTKSMLNHINKDCLVVIFPSCYFSFYQPHVKTLTHTEYNELLIQPSWHSHDIELIRIFLYAKSDDEIISNYYHVVNSPDFIKKSFLENIFNNNIAELVKRENEYSNYVPSIPNSVLHIKLSKFINDNYKKKLLFYNFAHPTKHTYKFLTDTILSFLGISLQEYPELLDPHFEPLIKNKIPIYKSIEQIVNFDIQDKYLALATTDFSKKEEIEEFVRKCINIYKQIDRSFLVETVFKIYKKLQANELVDGSVNKWEF